MSREFVKDRVDNVDIRVGLLSHALETDFGGPPSVQCSEISIF